MTSLNQIKKSIFGFNSSYKTFLVLASLIFSFNTSKASHALGGEITYSCTATPDVYDIEFKFFRDCDGIGAPNGVTLSYRATTGCPPFSVSMPRVEVNDITPLCPGETSTCAGGTIEGVEENIYRTAVTLPGGCGNWTIGFETCCRNNAITNLSIPGNQGIYIKAILDPNLMDCNNSPVFANAASFFGCVNQPVLYNHGVIDVDGDDLQFSLIDCAQSPTTGTVYVAPFSGASPVSTTPTGTLSIDANTGAITFVPDVEQVAVMCVLVEEFRGGVKIGEVVRDIQFKIENCSGMGGTNDVPTIAGPFVYSASTNMQLCFDINSADADGDLTRLTTNNGIPSGTFTPSLPTPYSMNASTQFCWTPTAADANTSKFFTVTVQDDSCPTTASNTYTFQINVTNSCSLEVECSAITDQNLSCRADLPPVDFDLPIVTDSCGALTFSALTIIPGNSGCPSDPLLVTRTYFINDGISAEQCMQEFTIVSNIGPSITCLPDEEVTCVADIVPDISSVTVNSECGNTEPVTFTGPTLITGDDGCGGATYNVEYSVVDNCGRTASCVQTFTLETGGLVIICPATSTITCLADLIPSPSDVTVISPCDIGFSVTTSDPFRVSGQENCDGANYGVIYTVTNECGQEASCSGFFRIENEGPSITCSGDEFVTCLSDILPDVSTVTVGSECGNTEPVTFTGPTLITGNEGCGGAVYEVVYSVEDNCGRSANCTQIFTLTTGDLEIICPALSTVTCADDIIVDPSDVTVNSTCGIGFNVTISEPEIISGTAECDGAIYRYIYTATDDCGRIAVCARNFIIENDGPMLTCPGLTVVECLEEVIATPDLINIVVSCDIGGDLEWSDPILTQGQDGCNNAQYEIMYTYTDNCGRSSSCIQSFLLSNVGPEILACAPDRVVECLADVHPEKEALVFEVSCDLGFTITSSAPIAQDNIGECNGAQYIINYILTDDCGRSAFCSQRFEIQNEAPIVIPPHTVRVACLDEYTPSWDDAWVITSCDLPIVDREILGPIYNEDKPLCEGSIVNYLYTVYDACGRMTCEAQVIMITSAADLVESQFPDLEVACGEIPAAETSLDICGEEVNLTMTETSDEFNGIPIMIRNYEGTSPCGESLFVEQIIIEDCSTEPNGDNRPNDRPGTEDGDGSIGIKIVKDLTVFPNPTSDYTNVSFYYETSNPLMIYIFNAQGMMLHSMESYGMTQTEIDVSSWPEGQYTIAVYSGFDLVQQQKLIKLN